MWKGLQEDTLIENINIRVKEGYTDIKNPKSYTCVYVHVWSKNMDDLNLVIEELNKNSKVEVVTPYTFMKLIKENIKK